MASTYTTNTGIELIATGEQSGTWGSTTNTNLQIIDRLTNGVGAITLSGTTHTLTTSDGTLSDGQYAVLVFGGTPSGTNTVTISPNDQNKLYVVKNNYGESVVLTQGSGGNVTVADGKSAIVYADGAGASAAVVDVTSTFPFVKTSDIGSTVLAYDSNLQSFVTAFTLPTSDGTTGQVLQTNGSGTLSFTTVSSVGDVVGPASATDNGIALFDGTTGKLLQDSASQDGVIHGHTIGRGNGGTSSNVVFGASAGAAITSAGNCVLVGANAGAAITSAANCVLVGFNAGDAITSGLNNTALGSGALSTVTTGTHNTAIGSSSMANAGTSAAENIGVGYATLASATGSQNVGIGYASLSDSSFSGQGNVAIGYFAGLGIETGSSNVCVGTSAGTALSPFNITTQSDRIVLGNSSTTNAYIQVAWTVTSDARDKTDVTPITHGLDLIGQLNPVTFKWDKRSKYFVKDENGNIIDRPTPDGTHKEDQPFAGFLAQEVQQAIEAVGFTDDIIVDREQDDLWKLKETALIPILVKAIQELKARVEALEAGV